MGNAGMIPLSVPNFEGNEEKYTAKAMAEGWVSTGGAYITEFEKSLADFLSVDMTVACQSGTSALHMCLLEAGVSHGDMVIAPALTFIAAVNPIRYVSASPVFMDCDDSLCMSSVKLREFCESECIRIGSRLIHRNTNKCVSAIIVVHVFGNLVDMEGIIDVAKEYNLKVIEDATEALGSAFTSGRYAGKMAGTIGDFGAFSFNGNKIITTGGGGAVVAKNKKELEHIKYISTQAKDDSLFYVHNEVGYNYRMTNLQAAIGVAQMEELPEFIERKNRNYDLYVREFKDFKFARILEFKKGTRSNKWFYSLIIDTDKVNITIKKLIDELIENNIQTRPIWGLIHEQKPYAGQIAYKINAAKYYSQRILSIPCSTDITQEQIVIVANTIKDILRRAADE